MSQSMANNRRPVLPVPPSPDPPMLGPCQSEGVFVDRSWSGSVDANQILCVPDPFYWMGK